MTRERPILFSGEMVRAILSGQKTQTRRAIKPQPTEAGLDFCTACDGEFYAWQDPGLLLDEQSEDGGPCQRLCPYGIPGDRIYVKEASWIWCEQQPDGKTTTGRPKFRYIPVGKHVVYRADAGKPTEPIDDNPRHCWRWKVARFMPRWASRLTLGMTEVRVQRVQEITGEEVTREGIVLPPTELYPRINTEDKLVECYHRLWDSLNKARGYAWESNPWVWVVSFRRIAL